eukprot:g16967.t1
MEQKFNEAIQQIFQRWTTLALATEQGWGGRDSLAKGRRLQAEVVDYLSAGSRTRKMSRNDSTIVCKDERKQTIAHSADVDSSRTSPGKTWKRRPISWENPGDVEELAHFLYLRIDELFNTETDDGSTTEVATLCLRLFNTCHQGDTSFADQVLQACNSTSKPDLAKSQGSERIEYATEEDELLDKLDGMEIDEGSDVESDDKALQDLVEQPTAAQPTVGGYAKRDIPEPVVDEDGFTSVVKGRRKPR